MMPGRNDPCPCGSGKKYKRCCGFIGDVEPLGQVLFASNRLLSVEDLLHGQSPGLEYIVLDGCCHPGAPQTIRAAEGPGAEVSCSTCDRSIILLATEKPLPGRFVAACCAGAGPRTRFARRLACVELFCHRCQRVLDRVRLRYRDPAAAPPRKTILAIVHRGAALRSGRLSDLVKTLGPDEGRVTDDLNAAVLDRAAWIAAGAHGAPPAWVDPTGILAQAYPDLDQELDGRAAEFLALGSIELGDGRDEAAEAGLVRTAEAYRRLIEARQLLADRDAHPGDVN